MLGKKSEKVTMTPEELAAFVDTRIAEDRVKREAHAKQAAQPVIEPITPAFQQAPSNPEFEAEVLAIFDAERGDISQAVAEFYQQIGSTRPDPRLTALFEVWRRHPVTTELLYPYDERNQLAGYIERLDQLRRMPSRAELMAESRWSPR